MDTMFKNLQVLVIDGQPECVKLLRLALGALGINDIAVAENSIAALNALNLDIYDVVFCDLYIGPIDLWEFTARLRMLEGGADNKKVYTFAWLHYGLLSLDTQF